MPDSKIIIVGGGPSGLSTAGALKAIGLEPVILDQDERIGGSWERRYDRLRLHTVRAFSGLAHYPIPHHFPRYVPKNQYAQYLQDYARHFDLKFVPAKTVRKVRRGADHNLEVETDAAGETWRGRVVVIATGQFEAPNLPHWPGLEEFQGQVVHSVRYRSGRAFAGQRVLVVGVGNSGAEIAADLAEQGAASAAISIRTPPSIVPRQFLGVPAQLFGISMSHLPPHLADRVGFTFARLALGDLKRYGLGRPAWFPFSARRVPVIDVGFVREVKNGRVKVRPAIARFTRRGVVFADGQEQAMDTVITATGFSTGLSPLLEVSGVLDAKGFPTTPQGQPTAQPGLFFMGYVESLNGNLYEANLASQRLAKNIQQYLAN